MRTTDPLACTDLLRLARNARCAPCSLLAGVQAAALAEAGLPAAARVDFYKLSSGSRVRASKVNDKSVSGRAAALPDLELKDQMELLMECSLDAKGKPRQRPLAFDEATRRDKMHEVHVDDCREVAAAKTDDE